MTGQRYRSDTRIAVSETTAAMLFGMISARLQGRRKLRGKDSNLDYPVQSRASYR